MRDYRIQIEIDYQPNLDHYPDDVTNKLEAMQFDVTGDYSLDELSYGTDVRVRVVEVEV